jgi:hypothetical protein
MAAVVVGWSGEALRYFRSAWSSCVSWHGFGQHLLLPFFADPVECRFVVVNQQQVFHPCILVSQRFSVTILIFGRTPAANLGYRSWSFEAICSSRFPIFWRPCPATSCLKQLEQSARKHQICL